MCVCVDRGWWGGGSGGWLGLATGMLQTATRRDGMFDIAKCWLSCSAMEVCVADK